MKTNRVVSIALILLFAAKILFAGDAWWDRSWKYRRKIYLPQYAGKSVGNACYIKLITGGHLYSDGSDLRIIDSMNKLVPCRMIFCDPKGVSLIAFKVDKNRGPYWLYFGSTLDTLPYQPQQEEWEPRGGILLQTWEYKGNRVVQSWEDMQKIMEDKGRPLGADLRKNVFQSFTPYAYNKPHLNVYEGYLVVQKAGKYQLAVSSDGPSFLLIDDQVIVQWPGSHGAIWSGDHYGMADLKEGLHKFQVYHQVLWNKMESQKIAVCSVTNWRKPSEKYPNYRPMPQELFLSYWRGDVEELECLGRDWTADLDFSQSTFLQSDFGIMIDYRFSTVERDGHSYRWDFGDGTTGTGTYVSHVYLSPGKYTVTLTETDEYGKKDSVSVTFEISIEPRLDDYNFKSRLKKYYEIIREYNLDNLKSNELLLVWDVGRLSEDFDLIFRSAEKITTSLFTLLEQRKSGNITQLLDIVKIAMRVAESLTGEDSRGYPIAEGIYRKLVDEIFSTRNESRARSSQEKAGLALSELYKDKIKDYDKAIKEYEKLLQYEISDSTKERVYAGLGDGWIMKKEVEKAKEYYEKVKKEKNYTYEQELAIEGGFAQQVEGYIATKELEGAKNALTEWGVTIPWKKLEPEYWMLNGKYLQETKKFNDAITSFGMVLMLSEDRFWIPEALYRRGECYLALGEKENARHSFEQLISGYPEDPFSEMAKKKQ